MAWQDGIIYKGDQIIVPRALRSSFLERLHASHLGYESTWRRAREVVYWPYMAEDIQQITKGCRVCELDGPAQRKGKGMSHEIPAQLWGKVGVDLFHCKERNYIIIVDYLSDFLEITELLHINSLGVIEAMKQQFARHGIPVVVHTDGGPQFVSEEFRELHSRGSSSIPYHRHTIAN